jgi:hypothetical protein
MNTTLLRDRLAIAESQMKTRLAQARATFAHSGIKGDHAEEAVREFLRQYMPRSYSIGTGEVIDSHGHRSAQTDVVITSEVHPFTFNEQEPGLFFVEGVCAGAEVKSALTRSQLRTSIQSAKTWKSLVAEPGKGTTAHASDEDLDRFFRTPPYFLLAFESQLSLDAIADELQAAGSYASEPAVRQIDALFVLDRGALIDVGRGESAMKLLAADGSALKGWCRPASDTVLFDALRWLTIVMPRTYRYEPVLPLYMFAPRERQT